jgi:hypothetical protein
MSRASSHGCWPPPWEVWTLTDNPDLWGGELPDGLAREIQAGDDRVLLLRSTASKAVTRGKNRVRAELAHVKGLVAVLTDPLRLLSSLDHS